MVATESQGMMEACTSKGGVHYEGRMSGNPTIVLSLKLLDERVFPALGILKVGAVLEQAGHQVEHLDLAGVENYTSVVEHYCRASTTRTFALTATTPQMPFAMPIASTIRKELPDAQIILGGPHATLVHAAAKAEQDHASRASRALSALQDAFSCVVAGDGERAVFLALESKGIVDADDPKSELWLTSKDFTESPWPARHLIDVESYHYTIDGERAMHLVAQLGCPFECGFCGGRNSPMLRRIRLRDPQNVINEMEYLHRNYGIRSAMLNDDELNVNKQMLPLMYGICNLGLRYGFKWKLRGFVKAELFTAEQAEALYQAGFRWLLCGFESAHPRILKNINKKATREDNSRMLHIAHEHGLRVKALMSFGHPGESEETIMATRDWLLEEKPDDFDCTIITKYPGTPYWDRSEQVTGDVYRYTFNGDCLYSRDIDFNVEQAFYKGRPGDYTSFVWTDYLTPERLVELRDAVEDAVRTKLKLPYPTAPAPMQFESSMGQTHICRKAAGANA